MKVTWPKTASAYDKLGQIGKGATSIVYRAKCKESGDECAIKVFDLRSVPDDVEARILKEISTLALLNHPNVVKLYTSFVTEDTELWMVMQLFAQGSVLDVMRDKFPHGLEEEACWAILFSTLSALQYLHAGAALHRDIKAGNIFVAADGQIVLGDFGVAAELIEGGEAATGRRTFAGTPCWMAPEVMMQQSSYSMAADIWSFGILAIELAKGRAPHAELNAMKVVMKVMSSPPPSLDEPEDKKKFSSKYRAMVKRCLEKEPEKRPTAAMLLKDFKKAKDAAWIKQALLAGLPPIWERSKQRAISTPALQHVDMAATGHGRGAHASSSGGNIPQASHPPAPVEKKATFLDLMSQVDASTKIVE